MALLGNEELQLTSSKAKQGPQGSLMCSFTVSSER